jgi:sulfite exporter TauE/SafE
MTWNIITAAFLLGIASNLHCIGMCGPLALAIPYNSTKKGWLNAKIVRVLLYNFGRVVTYAFLGVFAGIIGLSIQFIGFLQLASIISGGLIILFAWKHFLPELPSFQFEQKLFQFIGSQFRKLKTSNSVGNTFLFGMLNGILPCGMVYLALLNAMLAPEIEISVLVMAIFGLGTLPAMIIIAFIGSSVQVFISKYKLAVPILLTFVGMFAIFRGADLGIPMLSPNKKIIVQKSQKTHEIYSKPEKAKSACCQKK